jgi:hypothetical protein
MTGLYRSQTVLKSQIRKYSALPWSSCCYDLIKYDLNTAAVKCNFYNRLRGQTGNSFIL